MVWATHTIDNTLPPLFSNEAEALEKIQGFFSSRAIEHEEEACSVEATPPSTPSGTVILFFFDSFLLVSNPYFVVLWQV